MAMKGTFQELTRPERLVYTSRLFIDKKGVMIETKNVLMLEKLGDKTKMTLDIVRDKGIAERGIRAVRNGDRVEPEHRQAGRTAEKKRNSDAQSILNAFRPRRRRRRKTSSRTLKLVWLAALVFDDFKQCRRDAYGKSFPTDRTPMVPKLIELDRPLLTVIKNSTAVRSFRNSPFRAFWYNGQ